MNLVGVGQYLGGMFGRQPAAQKVAQAAGAVAQIARKITEGGDIVELSSNVPQPLEAATLEAAGVVAQKLRAGQPLSTREMNRLRNDRVFAALTVLNGAAVGGGTFQHWPGGIPAPTGDELDEAYRRLSQRLVGNDYARDPEALNALRVEILDAFRMGGPSAAFSSDE